MKRLLYSKVFRKNLFNWLFMYIAVIGLFTSVVTYSKYISSLQSDADAKVAKFDASITYDEICSGIDENQICNNGSHRPTSDISFYFTVDTTNIEVSTIFVTRITVLEYFKNISVYDVTENSSGVKINEFNNTNNVLTLTETIHKDDTYVRKYKLTMNYDHENYDNDFSESHPLNGAVVVGYSATQKD